MKEDTTTAFNTNIKWLVSIAIIVVGVVGPYYKIQTDIALIQQAQETIKSNHLQHLQDLAQDISTMATVQSDQQKQIIELQKQLIVLIGR